MEKHSLRLIFLNSYLSFSLAFTLAVLVPVSAFAAQSNDRFDQITPEGSDQLEARIWLASDHEYAELEREVVRVIQDDPYSAFGHYLLALLLVRDFSAAPQNLDVLRRASDLAQQSVELAPSKDYGYVALAEVLDLIGQAQKATELITRSIMHGMEPSWRVYFVLAKLNAEVGSSEQVFAYLEQAMAYKDAQVDIVAPYVVAMIEAIHDKAERQRQLISWNNRFPHIEFKQAIAIAMADSGDYETASKLYGTMLGDPTAKLEATFNNAVLQYRHLGKIDNAHATLKSLYPESDKLSPSLQFMLNTHLGVISLMQNKAEKAETYFLVSAEHAPDTKAFIRYVHQQFIDHNNAQNLSRFYEKLIDQLPGHAVLWALLGELQTEQDQNYTHAIESYSNAILLEPKQTSYYNGLGITYYRMKRYRDALRVFNSAISIDPRDAVAHYNQACMLARLGRSEHALASLREAITLNPGLVETALHDEDFASIRDNQKFNQLVSGPTEMEYSEARDPDNFAH